MTLRKRSALTPQSNPKEVAAESLCWGQLSWVAWPRNSQGLLAMTSHV